jgi:hypothetical protein
VVYHRRRIARARSKPGGSSPTGHGRDAQQADESRELNRFCERGVSDERLMLAFSQGSSEAFTELFARYTQPIYGFFRRRLAEPYPCRRIDLGNFSCFIARRLSVRTPSSFSNVSLCHWLQDSARASPQSRPARLLWRRDRRSLALCASLGVEDLFSFALR